MLDHDVQQCSRFLSVPSFYAENVLPNAAEGPRLAARFQECLCGARRQTWPTMATCCAGAVYAIRDVCETAWAITVHHPPPSRHSRPDHLPPPGTSPNTTWPRPVLLDHPGARPNLASTVSHRGVFVWHPTDMADMVRWRGW